MGRRLQKEFSASKRISFWIESDLKFYTLCHLIIVKCVRFIKLKRRKSFGKPHLIKLYFEIIVSPLILFSLTADLSYNIVFDLY